VKIGKYIKEGYSFIYDIDIKQYFDSIPHNNLMDLVMKRILDKKILGLIWMWINTPVMDSSMPFGAYSNPGKGVPQGGVISPLLSNIYLHEFDKAFHLQDGPYMQSDARLIRYADDFIILTRNRDNRIIHWIQRTLERTMGLQINPEKSRIVSLNENGASVDFLGYRFDLRRIRKSSVKEVVQSIRFQNNPFQY